MKARIALAGILAPLICNGPAAAQTLGSVTTSSIGDPIGLPRAERSPRLSPSISPMVQDVAPGTTRRGLIGSWPITAGLSAGLGLLEVNRDVRRERALRRLQPMKDVGRQTDRIAAVGLNLSF